MVLIYADFMKADDEDRLILSCLGTHRDLQRFDLSLKEGLELVFYNDDVDEAGNRDDLVVKGVVEFDSRNQRWRARIDWDAIKNISKLTLEEQIEFGITLRNENG